MSFDRRIARADAKIQREAMRPLDEAARLADLFDDPEPTVVVHSHLGAKAGALHRGPGNVAVSTRRHYEVLAQQAAAAKVCDVCEGTGAAEYYGTVGSCEP